MTIANYFKTMVMNCAHDAQFITECEFGFEGKNTLKAKVFFGKMLAKRIANRIFEDVYNNILGPVAMIIVMAIATAKVVLVTKNITTYHNPVHGDGTPWTVKDLKEALDECKASTIFTNEGKIALIHGLPDGRHYVEFEVKEREALFDLFEAGDYKLVSCYNGNRSDISDDSHTFVRDEHTLTPYPSAAIIVGRKLLVGSDKLFQTALVVSNTMYWRTSIMF